MNVYCIPHEKNVFVLDNHHGHLELVMSIRDDFVTCFGPFTSCPPPELPADWIGHVVPPTPEELVQIDQNAMELAFDLELS